MKGLEGRRPRVIGNFTRRIRAQAVRNCLVTIPEEATYSLL